jgi:large subunit ribosomal protein LP0
MAGAESGSERKQAYFVKLIKLLDEYNKVFIVGADNVGSSHMQKIRIALRGKAIVLMGKNTMIRKAIRGHAENNKSLEALIPHIKENIGFVFVKDDLQFVKKVIEENKVAAPAKAGAIAPSDVVVPAGNTGLEPTQTSFLQALNIPSKINRGQIEIINDVHLITTGQKVGQSESALLAKLDIKPFKYGLIIKSVYDNGSIYDAALLSLTDDDLLRKFRDGVKNVACVSLAIGYPTLASVPHSIVKGYKNAISIGLATEYSFPQVDKFKNMLANPGAFTQAAPKKDDKKPEKVEEKKPKVVEEPKEEEEEMGLSLFD